MSEELHVLRKRVQVLEAWQETVRDASLLLKQRDDALAELAALKQGKGEPVAVVAFDSIGWRNMLDGLIKLPDGTSLYTSAQTIPAGYVLVPVEPTSQMIDAAMELEYTNSKSWITSEIYKSMISAAPKQGETP